jgi:two-component system, OmpR family, response regulator
MVRRLERILVIEDEEDIQAVLQMSLEDLGGYHVDLCSSGAEALDNAPATRPDLILLDVMMPDMDGPATLHALRGIPALARTPVVFITAQKRRVPPYDPRDSYVLGMLEKPFQPRRLLAQIAELWGLQEPEIAHDLDPDRLAVIRHHYLGTLPSRMERMDALWATRSQVSLAALYQQAHQVSGTGATLGLDQLSAAAQHLEELIAGICASGAPDPLLGEVLTAEASTRISSALDTFRHAAQISLKATTLEAENG